MSLAHANNYPNILCLDKNPFKDLPERIAPNFSELDSDICRDLSGTNEEYASSLEISKRYPIIEQALGALGQYPPAEEHIDSIWDAVESHTDQMHKKRENIRDGR